MDTSPEMFLLKEPPGPLDLFRVNSLQVFPVHEDLSVHRILIHEILVRQQKFQRHIEEEIGVHKTVPRFQMVMLI